MEKTKTTGIDWIKVDFYWHAIESDDSLKYRWEAFDSLVVRAKRKELNIFGIMTDTPRWASSDPDTSEAPHWRNYPPRNTKWWYNVVNQVVERYDGDTVDPAHGRPPNKCLADVGGTIQF